MSIGGGVYHRLGQNVNIGHRDGLDLAGRFDDATADLERRGTARRAGRQGRPKRHQRHQRFFVSAAIGQTSRRTVSVHGPALTAEPCPRPFCRPRRRAAFGFFQQPVGQHQPGALFHGRGGPDGILAAIVILGGIAVIEVLELILGPSGELKPLIPLLEEMLAAASTGQDREEGVVVATGVLFLGIGQRQEQLGHRGGLGAVEGDHHLVQAPEEEMHLGPQQRFAALLGGGPQTRQAKSSALAWSPSGSRPGANRCEVCQAASFSRLGLLEDLRGLIDVFVGD